MEVAFLQLFLWLIVELIFIYCLVYFILFLLLLLAVGRKFLHIILEARYCDEGHGLLSVTDPLGDAGDVMKLQFTTVLITVVLSVSMCTVELQVSIILGIDCK